MQEEHRRYHEVANIFPLLQGEEFEALKADIATNGLLETITLHTDESIIDGRNRHRACIETATKARFETWGGDDADLLEFVISKNMHRRHMDSSQRAACAVAAEKLMARLEDEARERTISLAGTRPNANSDPPELIPEGSAGEVREKAAKMFDTNARYVQDAKKLKTEEPELFEEVHKGNTTIPKAKRKARAKVIAAERKVLAETAQTVKPSDRWKVLHGDIAAIEIEEHFDFIITDPPYPKEYLPLYETLAKRALEWLKPGGLVLAMCGESYLDQIMTLMGKHLSYYWTGCYRTPGQPTSLRHRQVNTSWKPILIYVLPSEKYAGKIFGDVWTSDGNDKAHHKWGQSESGMLSIVAQVCLPGQSILDPFCGAGTTGVAALKHGCLFTGIDLDIDNVNLSIGRLGECEQ